MICFQGRKIEISLICDIVEREKIHVRLFGGSHRTKRFELYLLLFHRVVGQSIFTFANVIDDVVPRDFHLQFEGQKD